MGKTRAKAAQTGVTFDTGALIALERGNHRMLALLQQVVATSGCIRIPAGVVGQAWRDGSRQVVLGRLLRSAHVEVEPLDDDLARACGELCAVTRCTDVIDASVVIVARKHGDSIITSDVDDLRRLDPSAMLERV